MSIFRHADHPEVRMRSFAVTFPGGRGRAKPRHLAPPHAADWHQLIHAVRGVVRAATAAQAWLVPPHRGLWIPAGVASTLEMHGEVALRMLYVRSGPRGLPKECTAINVPPLLRELIVRVSAAGALDAREPRQARLAGVIVDELRQLRMTGLHLPMPSDPRAARFAALAAADPRVSRPLAAWLEQSGASRRTLERIFREETALSLGAWLRRLLLMEALARLGAGVSVGTVAEELGYNSPSSFISMFRREMGASPARYFAAATGASPP